MMGRKGALSETEIFKIIERLHSKFYLGNSEKIRPIVPLKNLSLAPLSAMDVLTREKFGSKHLFLIELCVRKSGITLCKLVKKCLKALVFLMYPNQLVAVS